MLEKIKEALSVALGISPDEITADSRFSDDLGADSLDLFELVMQLEDEYDIQIPDESLESISTVGDLISYLASVGIEE